MFVLYGMLKNLAHEASVTYAISATGKNSTTGITFFLEKLWTETETNWKQIKLDPAHLSPAGVRIIHRRETLESVKNILSYSTKNLKSVPFV